MTLPAFITWDFDPVLFTLFGHPIVWYGLLFALGLIILGPWIEKKMWEHEKLDSKWFESLAVYVFVGTIVGARLGHVLFYDPAYYLANPAKIFVTWEGGLASHGGTIGIIIACWLYSRRVTRKSILWVLDRLAVPTGIVAAMIRLGNLTNSEIFGRPTTLPWGFRFIRSEEYRHLVPNMDMGCHPTQIYEALCYLAVFALCMWLYWKRDAARRYSGLIVGVFLTAKAHRISRPEYGTAAQHTIRSCRHLAYHPCRKESDYAEIIITTNNYKNIQGYDVSSSSSNRLRLLRGRE